jgi:hypothetical protein
MSESMNVQIATLTMGQFSGAAAVPLLHVPAEGGGITVLEAWALQNGAGGSAITSGTAIGAILITMGTVATGGTPAVNGTIGAFAGTIIPTATSVNKCTISTPFVEKDYWIGFDETAGTIAGGLTIQLAYVVGK